MTDTSVQRFYRYHAYVYDSTRWMILHRRKNAVTRLNLNPESNVIEIGCGTGLNFNLLLNQLDPNRGKLVGLDFSADMLQRAQRRIDARGWANVDLIQADASLLDLGRNFDAVFFAYSLTMIPDWRAALERAWNHLKPNGRLVILDFAQFHAWGPLAPLMRTWLRLNHVDTKQPYTDELRRIAGNINVEHWLGGYCFIATSKKA